MPTADPMPDPLRRPSSRIVWAMVAALLAAYFAMAFTASLGKTLSYDEGEELAIGYNVWLRKDFRMESANGDLVKRWATLPFLIFRPAFPSRSDIYWRAGGAYEVAYEFFFKCGNRAGSLLRQGRVMNALLGVALGLMIFLYSRELFGNLGGLFSLGLFAFSPHMLAFGGMVSTEMSICLTLLGSAWCIWRLLHDVTWGRLLASLVFFGLLVLAKPTALVMLPLAGILIAVKLWCGRPMAWRLGASRVIRPRSAQAAVMGGLIILHGLVGWGAVWADYDFRYPASPDPDVTAIAFRQETVSADPIDPTVAAFLAWSDRTHFLPQSYLRGIKLLLGENDYQPAFMDGWWKLGGRRTFFPYAMWVKTPPGLILLFGLALAGWGALRRKMRKNPESAGKIFGPVCVPSLYEAMPFAALAAVYFGFAIMYNLNIGFRHVLPIYPAIYVLAGALGAVWPAARTWERIVLALLSAWLVFDSISIYPDYLAYFSPVAGGPSQGYRHLVDSSLDWGMDLPGLKRWLDRNNPDNREPVFFAYFGTGDPDYYGIKSHRLPGRPDWRDFEAYPLTPGIYAISATLYEGIYTKAMGPWNKIYERFYRRCIMNLMTYQMTAGHPAERAALLAKYPQSFWDHQYKIFEVLRFNRLCAWLRHKRPPDDNVGYSILIWHLNADEIHEACSGAPVELRDKPLQSGD